MNKYKKKMNKIKTKLATLYKNTYLDFQCDNGRLYRAKLPHCLGCKYCKHVFYDYLNGPYAYLCEKNMEFDIQDDGYYCLKFEPDENTEVNWKVIK